MKWSGPYESFSLRLLEHLSWQFRTPHCMARNKGRGPCTNTLHLDAVPASDRSQTISHCSLAPSSFPILFSMFHFLSFCFSFCPPFGNEEASETAHLSTKCLGKDCLVFIRQTSRHQMSSSINIVSAKTSIFRYTTTTTTKFEAITD